MRHLTILMTVTLWGGCAIDNEFREQTQTDTFGQAANNIVDILWVIDDSNSMQAEQDLLADGFSAFAEAMEQSNTDFQLGVVSTSFDETGGGGVLLGDPPFLTNADAAYQEAFVERAQIGTGGSDKEKGLEAATFALGPTMVYGGPNDGFLRPDGQLLVVFVSDEDDMSPLSVDGYHQAFAATKGDKAYRDPRWLSASAVVGTKPTSTAIEESCVSDNGEAYYGQRYIALANQTGGLVESICEQDFGRIASDLGLTFSDLSDTFYLSDYPSLDTLEVSLLEVVGESPDETFELLQELVIDEDFTYDSELNALVFATEDIPPSGVVVHAEYKPLARGAQSSDDDTDGTP